MNALASVAAVSIASATAVAAPQLSGLADEKLFALERRLLAAVAAWKEALDRSEAAEQRYYDLSPEMPERKPPAEYYDLYKTITLGEMGMLSNDHPLKVWSRKIDEEHERRLAAYRAAVARVRDETGVDLAEAERDQRGDEAWEIAHEIWDTPTGTVAGLMVKVRAAELVDPGQTVDEAYDAIATDIRALAARAA